MPGQRDRPDVQPSGDEIARDDGDPEALAELGLVLDVVGVGVSAQKVRRRQPLPLDELEQRLERRPAVDEHGRAPGHVADDVRVREPALVHRPTDDHWYTLRKSAEPG